MSNNKKAPLRRYVKSLGSIGILALFLLSTATPTHAFIGNSCKAEDQTSGVGGQQVSCTFNCPDGTGDVSVGVSADDPDATVSGNGSCPGGGAHCTGKQSCSDTKVYSGGGLGECSADSDEAFDSGLYVHCGASAAGPPIVDPDPLCPPVCVGKPELPGTLFDDDVIPHHGIEPNTEYRLGKFDTMERPHKSSSQNAGLVAVDVWERAIGVLPDLPALAVSFDSYVFMHFDGETAIGITCQAGICDDFTPTLQSDADGFRLAA